MTNKERFIKNMSNKQLALFLGCGSQIIDNQIDTNPSLTDDEEIRKQVARNCNEIEKWLSQEVELSANKMFEEFIDETKQRLLAYEMDESCFDDYDDEDRQMMRRLREALYGK